MTYVPPRSRLAAPSDTELIRRMEELINASKNRYRITVQVANRAKRRRYEDFDDFDDGMKAIPRAILEMYDEMTQPEIIGDGD
ncbi:MAG: DNA-directed RNA polymerase subunit omega [Thermostichales cyanobacterium SZTDM-1c_bins_54]